MSIQRIRDWRVGWGWLKRVDIRKVFIFGAGVGFYCTGEPVLTGVAGLLIISLWGTHR